MKTRLIQTLLLLLEHAPLVLFALLFAGFSVASPRFFQIETLVNTVKQASYIGVVAVGMTLVLLTGGIDLSVGSTMYLSAVVSGLAMQRLGLPAPAALLVCLAVGALVGVLNALLITRCAILPFVATLGTMVAGRGLALLLCESRPIPFPESILAIGSAKFLGVVPWTIMIFAAVVAASHVFLTRMQSGRQLYAVGHDLNIAKKAGIPTRRILSLAYIACATLAALGGFISVAQMGIINAGFGKGDEFDAIAAAVLGGASLFGGVGRVFPGTVLGAVLIRMIGAGLVFSQVDLYLQPLVASAMIFLAVLLDSTRNRLLMQWKKRRIVA